MREEQRNHRIITETLYMNRYLWKLGTEEAVYYRELKPAFLNFVVDPIISRIRQNVSSIFPECKVVPVGSFKDGTQVGIPNEFDFIFEIPHVMSLVNQSEESLQIIPVNIPLTGPQQSRHMVNRTYVNLYMKSNTTSHPWGEYGKVIDACFLDPRKLQSSFQQCIEGTLREFHSSQHFEIKLRGPAVCVFVYMQTSDLEENKNSPATLFSYLEKEICIKIDLVLGILFKVLRKEELYINHENLSWRVGGATWTENAPRIDKCHLVMSGDFFHVSFCLFEAQTIRQHITDNNVQGQVKQACIRSIKCLRDSLNPTDDHEGKVLATYPLKASFITECLNPNNSWEKRHLAERVVSILDRVYEEGQSEVLNHPFVRNEPIFTREDKSYHEAQRMLNELVKYSKSHHRSIIKNWILTCVIFTLFLAELMFKYVTHVVLGGPSMVNANEYFLVKLGFAILFGVPLVALISATTCFDVPCCWRFGHRYAKFSMFRNLHIFRLVLLVIYLIIFTIYTVATICYFIQHGVKTDIGLCNSYTSYNLLDDVHTMVIAVFVICVLLYVIIMLVIINIKCCSYKNSFRPALSCRNHAHEIIMIDISNDSNKIYQRRLIENGIEII